MKCQVGLRLAVPLFLLTMSTSSNADLIHQWTFNGNEVDLVGNAHGTLFNEATIVDGRLSLDALDSQYFQSSPIDDDIEAKTLIAWVSLNDLDEPRSGSILTIANSAGTDIFDGIIYAERTSRQWMAGSNFFRRTPLPDNGGFEESAILPEEIMMAISYDLDGDIFIYRNGEPYADYITETPPIYVGGEADVLIGPRHQDLIGRGGPANFFDGLINEARVYNTALSPAEVAEVFQAGVETRPNPDPPPPPPPTPIQLVHQWTFDGTLEDSVGSAHGELFNGAELTPGGQLALDAFQDQYFRTDPIDDDITEKTLVAWVQLNDLDDPRAGSILTIENADGVTDTFDGIIYAERSDRQWMAGSNFFRRTPQADNGGTEETVTDDEIMMAISYDRNGGITIFRNGEVYADYATSGPPTYDGGFADVLIGPRHEDRIAAGGPTHFFDGLIDEARIYDGALSEDEIAALFAKGPGTGTRLLAGDADQDLDFDQLDLVRVQIAAKYLTGQNASWGEGDWDGAPGGEPGNPPAGDGKFDQLDIIAALGTSIYLTGPYAALSRSGAAGDDQTSLVYDVSTGVLSVDAPSGRQLTSINVTSNTGKFVGAKPAVLDGAFDNFAADNLFKATFGGSFGSISFGNVLPAGIPEVILLGVLIVNFVRRHA